MDGSYHELTKWLDHITLMISNCPVDSGPWFYPGHTPRGALTWLCFRCELELETRI